MNRNVESEGQRGIGIRGQKQVVIGTEIMGEGGKRGERKTEGKTLERQ